MRVLVKQPDSWRSFEATYNPSNSDVVEIPGVPSDVLEIRVLSRNLRITKTEPWIASGWNRELLFITDDDAQITLTLCAQR